uniref:Inositol-1-monophosphatase n=1 Tax=Magnetococcus massalia (strain MO-1) TaxID=451514 RepID=A0A1S7LPI4_MAGMO|nr:Inositol-1-monophosphatase [Candidatus Magnetococcus massalia]
MNLSPALNVAVRAARDAGRIALRHFDQLHRLEIREKAPQDLVTNADLEVEEILISQLKKAYPQYGILAEESGRQGDNKGLHWIIDPIDGTLNFSRGLPHFAISIALARGTDVQGGLIYDPVRDELFTAEKGRGAFLNDRRMRVSQQPHMVASLLGTGFPFRHQELKEPYLKAFREVLQRAGEVRRAGSAALDLAYVAAGRFDAFWELRLSPWDIAAGQLMVTEAGGYVSDMTGDKNHMRSGDIVAGNTDIQPQLLELLQHNKLDDLPPRPAVQKS